MKIFKVSITLFVLAFIFVASTKCKMIDFSKSSSASMQIPASEMQKVVTKANDGDIISTKRLVNHYLFSEGDELTGLQWARLAAEQGSLDSRKFVVDVLSRSELDADKEESRKLTEKWNLNKL